MEPFGQIEKISDQSRPSSDREMAYVDLFVPDGIGTFQLRTRQDLIPLLNQRSRCWRKESGDLGDDYVWVVHSYPLSAHERPSRSLSAGDIYAACKGYTLICRGAGGLWSCISQRRTRDRRAACL